jgi:hypothetical protein
MYLMVAHLQMRRMYQQVVVVAQEVQEEMALGLEMQETEERELLTQAWEVFSP